ncbi:MAG TPA: hypothetical protein VF596_22170 [Pyrinomonadaceae bacterium]
MTKLTKRIGSIAMAFVFLFGIFIVSGTVAEAQWRDRNNDRREDRRNNRWGNTNKRAIENLVRRVEDRTDSFVRQFDRALDNSRADGTRREDRLNELASELERATNQLRREFDRSDSLQENRDEVERCISIASRIDRAVSRGRIGNGVQNTWRNLRNELNALARAYNVRSV